MNKRILGIFIPLFIGATIFAQDDPIVASGGYSKIYKGKEASFEKAVSSHVARMAWSLTNGLHLQLL